MARSGRQASGLLSGKQPMSAQPPAEYALQRAASGHPVLPLCYSTEERPDQCACHGCWDKETRRFGPHTNPRDVGKAPIASLVSHGFESASADAAVVKSWWQKHPRANVGEPLEVNGWLVIDPDSEEAQAEAHKQGLPATLIRHSRWPAFICQRPPDCPAKNVTRQGASGAIDVLGTGYLVTFGRHRAGHLVSLDEGDLKPAPTWAVELLTEAVARRIAVTPSTVAPLAASDEPPVRLSERGLSRWRGELVEMVDGHVDRSQSLWFLGLDLAESGASASTIAGTLAERDAALGWNKYNTRPDRTREYAVIAAKVLAEPAYPSLEPTINGSVHPPDPPAAEPVERTNGRGSLADCLDLVPLSAIEPEEIHWLWQNRIPLGKLTVLMGDPGLGKSLLTISVASVVSIGGTFKDDATAEQGAVVLLTAEDGLADTVRPRLDAAGANIEQVYALRSVKDKATDLIGRMFQLSQDILLLEEAITRTGAKLVIMDPLNAYLGGVDSHKAAEVRAVLAPLSAMAERTGVAVLVVHHLNKGTSANALYRAGGSLDFVAAARSVLGVAPDPNEPERRQLVSVKVNIAQRPVGLGYRVKSSNPLKATAAPIIEWDSEPVLVDPTTAFSNNETGEERGFRAELREFLEELLKDGPVPASVVKNAVKDRLGGASETTFRKCRLEMGIRVKLKGFGSAGQWFWSLPDTSDDQRDPDTPQTTTPGGTSTQGVSEGVSGEIRTGEPPAVPSPSSDISGVPRARLCEDCGGETAGPYARRCESCQARWNLADTGSDSLPF